MARPSQVWLITDTHFNDEAMLTLRPKGYEYKIVKACRRLLAPQDTLIHLGDVIFSRPGELKNYLGQIPCAKKILVRGNHDRQPDNWYRGQGFDFVCDGLTLKPVYLTHEPCLTALPPGCTINVHGHFHTFGYRTEVEKLLYNPDKNKLYALETSDYAPVPLQSFVPKVAETNPPDPQDRSTNPREMPEGT